jgi:PA14 domain
MKMSTAIGSRFFLLILAIGSPAIIPSLFGGTSLPNVPPSAVALGLKAPPPKLVIADPTRNLPPYVPPKPPAPLKTVTLTFSDFTSYVSPDTTQGWQQGSTLQTIMIPPQPNGSAGLGDKAVALATSYDTASYEADVTVGSSAPGDTGNAGFIVHVTNPSAGGFDTLTGYYIGLDVSGHLLVVGREDYSWTNFIQYPVASVTPGSTHHLKVTTRGNAILVDLDNVHVISVNDATNNLKPAFLAGSFGVRRFGPSLSVSNITINTYPKLTSPTYDFSKVVGAVYNPSSADNAIDFWNNYDPEEVDHELRYAEVYGMNTITVYLHYFNWLADRVDLLSKFENLLQIAARHGLKVAPIFYDDCWNYNPAPGPQPAPIWGVHNSQWVESPGHPVEENYFKPISSSDNTTYKTSLQDYITDFVSVHRTDRRIIYWEIMNEPGCSGDGSMQQTRAALMNDGRIAILAAGATQPINSPQVQEDEGTYFSDFYAFHPYNGYSGPINGSYVNALNSETLERGFNDAWGSAFPMTMAGVVNNYGDKSGFLVWELMIGNTNTRFHWGQTASDPALIEPVTPFQGTIYPDGHPWQTSEIQALTGNSSLPVLNVSYYNNTALSGAPVKTSITPAVDFDLNTYRGTNSPDASAGVPSSGYSIRWTGFIENVQLHNAGSAKEGDPFVFFLNSDDVARVWIGSKEIIDKESAGLSTRAGSCNLIPDQPVPITIEYTHSSTGPASMHVYWLSTSAKGNIIQIVSFGH